MKDAYFTNFEHSYVVYLFSALRLEEVAVINRILHFFGVYPGMKNLETFGFEVAESFDFFYDDLLRLGRGEEIAVPFTSIEAAEDFMPLLKLFCAFEVQKIEQKDDLVVFHFI